MRAYSVASLFCGLGGLDLGFEWEGFNIIWASDLSKSATRSYKLNFDISAVNADITEFDIARIPKTDVVIGGPPCQSFSLVGQRKHDDPRGKLVFRFIEVVRQKEPEAFVMENVPGMSASTIGGRRLPEILEEEFSKLGYTVQKLELNATDYLVPQRRRRLVLVGTTKATVSQPDGIAFAKECYRINFQNYDCSAKAALGDLGPCSEKGARAPYADAKPSVFAKLMRSARQTSVSLHEHPRMSKTDLLLVKHIPPGGNYQDIPDEISPGRVLKFKETGGRTTTYGRLHPDRPSYTINTYFRRPNVGCNFHYSEPRLITPREAMRLQSIPDWFEINYTSQDDRNALIGNAVPPLMGRAIAWTLRRALETPTPPRPERARAIQLQLT